ncbi:nucleotide-binding universal stress UspA family protein [Rhodobium orientis]|uniref:Universal stress protein UspA n=1 Tax=Rhodobium orientis TaxID=34017 RepID=A0A327JNA0_9HYPH|nr:universal stress protein [Rhodobium orientis]MBB4304117.1 nucleotide-binding universal stress UspA family protein [Rhodobium orientis]MBK5948626.1 universal stress protein UspA [Rhodobium orientis]RAI24898.1 universal stress protein UspA [Rhodobium orientis]
MAIKDIVTVLDLNRDGPAPKMAVEVARFVGAHVTGLSPIVEPVVPGYVTAPIPGDFLEASIRQARERAEKSAAGFEETIKRSDINGETGLVTIGDGAWGGLLARTRLSDLIVIGQEDADHPEPLREALIEAALFDSGVPLLLVPYVSSPTFADRKAMVAWDGSRTASRAVHAALPMLELAKKVTVVCVENGARAEGEAGADIALYLARHGLKVEIDRIPMAPTGVGDTLLNYVADNAIDLVVMGGYGHSRMREFIIGGATRSILKSMTVPVMMAH